MSKKYQVFISFKNEQRDAAMGEALYHALEQRGIKTFFSNISINQAGEAQYGQMIDEALDECNILVAVGTRVEHMESSWVNHEITTVRNEILSGNKDQSISAICSYISEDIDVHKLPIALRQNQSFTNLEKLVNFINQRLYGVQEIQKKISENYQQVKKSRPQTQSIEERLPIGCLIDGRYEIMRQIGKGGMSVVFLVYDKRLNCMLALKAIQVKDGMNMKIVTDSIKAEITILKQMDNEHIPHIIDVIEKDNMIWTIMDYVEGEDLATLLKMYGVASYEKVVGWGIQLCEVLSYLHSKNIIYRDMKPSNVIEQPNGVLKLLDFGICREYKTGQTSDTVCLGTKGYAAPEQYGGLGQTDSRTDIYGLGMTLYHLFSGHCPAEPPYDIYLEDIRNERLRQIIEKCIQVDPDKRYQSVEALEKDLRNFNKKKGLSFLIEKLWGNQSVTKEKAKTPQSALNIPAATDSYKMNKDSIEPDTGILEDPEYDTVLLGVTEYDTGLLGVIEGYMNIQQETQPSLVIPDNEKVPLESLMEAECPVTETQDSVILEIKHPQAILEEKRPQAILDKKQIRLVAVCICSNVRTIDEKEQFIHVYLFDDWDRDSVWHLIQEHQDYLAIRVGDVFELETGSPFVIKINSDTLGFEGPMREKNWKDLFAYTCFKRSSMLDCAEEGQHQVSVEIIQNEKILFTDTMSFQKKKSNE